MSSNHLLVLAAGDGGFMDFDESIRSPKVLQGQEKTSFMSLYYGCDTVTKKAEFDINSLSHSHTNHASTGARKITSAEFTRVHPSSYAGFTETNRFPRVLQGQEICPLRSLTGKVDLNLNSWGKTNVSYTNYNLHQQATKPNFHSLGSEILQSSYFPYGQGSSILCSKSTNFNLESVPFNTPSAQIGTLKNEVGLSSFAIQNEQKLQDNISAATSLGANMRISNDENFKGKVNPCKLFGFSLSAAETTSPNLQNSAKRSCTKVSDDSNTVIL
jgi:hypothetical protein